MEAAMAVAVDSGPGASCRIEFESEGVSTTLGEEFKDAVFRMVPPNDLAFEINALALIEAGPFYARTDTRPLCSIQPPVRSPAQRIRGRVRVFQSEPGEVHRRIAIGHIVVVAVRPKNQIGRIEHPNTSAAALDGGDHVEAVEEHFVGLEGAV